MVRWEAARRLNPWPSPKAGTGLSVTTLCPARPSAPSTNALNVALGKAYDEADPTAIFANVNAADNTASVADNGDQVKVKTKTPAGKTKTKTKLVFYSATKTEMNSTSTNAAKQ